MNKSMLPEIFRFNGVFTKNDVNFWQAWEYIVYDQNIQQVAVIPKYDYLIDINHILPSKDIMNTHSHYIYYYYIYEINDKSLKNIGIINCIDWDVGHSDFKNLAIQ